MKYSPTKFLTHHWLNGIDSLWLGLSILAILKVGGVFLNPFTWPITWGIFARFKSFKLIMDSILIRKIQNKKKEQKGTKGVFENISPYLIILTNLAQITGAIFLASVGFFSNSALIKFIPTAFSLFTASFAGLSILKLAETWDGFRKIPSHSRTIFEEKIAHFSKMILLSLVESACYAESSIAIASTILGIFPTLFSAPVTCAIGGTCLLAAGTTIWIENFINQEKRRRCDESLQTIKEDFSTLPWIEYYFTFSSTKKESWKHSLFSFLISIFFAKNRKTNTLLLYLKHNPLASTLRHKPKTLRKGKGFELLSYS